MIRIKGVIPAGAAATYVLSLVDRVEVVQVDTNSIIYVCDNISKLRAIFQELHAPEKISNAQFPNEMKTTNYTGLTTQYLNNGNVYIGNNLDYIKVSPLDGLSQTSLNAKSVPPICVHGNSADTVTFYFPMAILGGLFSQNTIDLIKQVNSKNPRPDSNGYFLIPNLMFNINFKFTSSAATQLTISAPVAGALAGNLTSVTDCSILQAVCDEPMWKSPPSMVFGFKQFSKQFVLPITTANTDLTFSDTLFVANSDLMTITRIAIIPTFPGSNTLDYFVNRATANGYHSIFPVRTVLRVNSDTITMLDYPSEELVDNMGKHEFHKIFEHVFKNPIGVSSDRFTTIQYDTTITAGISTAAANIVLTVMLYGFQAINMVPNMMPKFA